MPPLLLGLALGATGAFLLDPQQGRRRRALLRDKVTRTVNEGREFADAATQDLRYRAQGLAARAKSWRSGAAPDEILAERVRAKLGRYSSHPGAIEVTAQEGRVVLSGDVLAAEQESLFDAVRSVRGVAHVENNLTAHQSAEGVSSLQGGVAPDRERFELAQDNWSPGVRLLTGGAGAVPVRLSSSPLGSMPFACWNSFTAARVFGPILPSAGTPSFSWTEVMSFAFCAAAAPSSPNAGRVRAAAAMSTSGMRFMDDSFYARKAPQTPFLKPAAGPFGLFPRRTRAR